jgi:hypothetical protein
MHRGGRGRASQVQTQAAIERRGFALRSNQPARGDGRGIAEIKLKKISGIYEIIYLVIVMPSRIQRANKGDIHAEQPWVPNRR